jgi:hypothetical protein
VYIWYDQSGNSNHAYNYTTGTTQPQFKLKNGKYLVLTINSNQTFLNLTSSITPYAMFCQFEIANSISDWLTLIYKDTDTGVRIYGTNPDTNGAGLTNCDWYAACSGTKYSYVINASTTTLKTYGNWNTMSLTSSSPPSWVFTYLFYGWTSTRYFDGYVSEFVLLNSSQSISNISQYYLARMIKDST